jgi:hypothetical protein
MSTLDREQGGQGPRPASEVGNAAVTVADEREEQIDPGPANLRIAQTVIVSVIERLCFPIPQGSGVAAHAPHTRTDTPVASAQGLRHSIRVVYRRDDTADDLRS